MDESSTEVQVVQSETGQEIIVFSAPNDGSISNIISPNIEYDGSKIEYDKRHYHIVDSTGARHYIVVTGLEKIEKIFEIFNSKISNLEKNIVALDSRVEHAKETILLYKKRLFLLKKEIDKIRGENEKYKDLYGDFSNPIQIIHELYRGNTISLHSPAVPPKKWKDKSLLKTGYRKWLSLFEEWGIIDQQKSNSYVVRKTFHEAKRIFFDKLGERDE